MPRVVWNGAIAFGLVHIPVNLYPGSTSSTLDFDLLDKRDFAPVGYQRVNNRTGKEVAPRELVKGYEYEKGEYVVVTDEDFRQANVRATQTVEIQAFVDAAEFAPCYFDTPASAPGRVTRCCAKRCARRGAWAWQPWSCAPASISRSDKQKRLG